MNGRLPSTCALRHRADLVEAAELHPEAVVLQQVEKQPERGLVEAVGAAHARHVVDDGHRRQRADESLVMDEILGIDMQIEDPVALLQARQMRAQMLLAAGPVVHQMEARAAHAALVQCVERLVVERGVDVRDAARRIPRFAIALRMTRLS